MLYKNKLPFAPSEIEDGYYYVNDRRRPSRKRIIEVCQGQVYDGRQVITCWNDYDIIGPVPSPEELESLTNACEGLGANV